MLTNLSTNAKYAQFCCIWKKYHEIKVPSFDGKFTIPQEEMTYCFMVLRTWSKYLANTFNSSIKACKDNVLINVLKVKR